MLQLLKNIKDLPDRSCLIRRRHFQLLEVMVAVFILLICAAPAMKMYTNMYVLQQQIIRENQRDHLSHLIHASLVEQLYKRVIPFSDLMDPDRQYSFEEPALKSELDKMGYQAFYYFKELKGKKINTKSEKPDMRLVTLLIGIKDKQAPKSATENNYQTKPRGRSGRQKSPDQENFNDPSVTVYKYKIYIMTPEGEMKEIKTPDEDEIPIEEKEELEEQEDTSTKPKFPSDKIKEEKEKVEKEKTLKEKSSS